MKKTTLVLGASTNKRRYAYKAIISLVQRGQEVIGIGRKSGFVNETLIYDKETPLEDIDTVTIYLNKLDQKSYYEYIVSLNPRRVIFNPGAYNAEFESLLDTHNITHERACTLTLLSLNIY